MNDDYCSKKGQWIEVGEKPQQGCRRDLTPDGRKKKAKRGDAKKEDEEKKEEQEEQEEEDVDDDQEEENGEGADIACFQQITTCMCISLFNDYKLASRE